ncbi:MAG: hypothetical protein IJP64_07210 [Oscillospiraceae bacterium]|nr:hypothetical protein [Oscillospiraceae bacterium]
MDKLSLDKMKNKGAATAAATIAAAGVLIGGSFEAPADILKEDAALAPPPIVETLNAEIDPGDGDLSEEEDAVAEEEEEKKKGGLRARTRELVLRMPLILRACVAVPLWGVGWALTSLASLLWAGVLSPVGAAIAKWIVIALMILAALAITVKTVFPKTPLKKIFNRRTLMWVLGGATVFCVADAALGTLYPDAPRLFDIARIVASAALLTGAVIPVLKHEKKARDKRKREEEETREREEAAARAAALEAAKETPEQAQARVEREVLELADSVSFR